MLEIECSGLENFLFGMIGISISFWTYGMLFEGTFLKEIFFWLRNRAYALPTNKVLEKLAFPNLFFKMKRIYFYYYLNRLNPSSLPPYYEIKTCWLTFGSCFFHITLFHPSYSQGICGKIMKKYVRKTLKRIKYKFLVPLKSVA